VPKLLIMDVYGNLLSGRRSDHEVCDVSGKSKFLRRTNGTRAQIFNAFVPARPKETAQVAEQLRTVRQEFRIQIAIPLGGFVDTFALGVL
jgi:hypothetical protein